MPPTRLSSYIQDTPQNCHVPDPRPTSRTRPLPIQLYLKLLPPEPHSTSRTPPLPIQFSQSCHSLEPRPIFRTPPVSPAFLKTTTLQSFVLQLAFAIPSFTKTAILQSFVIQQELFAITICNSKNYMNIHAWTQESDEHLKFKHV